MANAAFVALIVFALFHISVGLPLITSPSECNNICEQTFSPHTYEQTQHSSFCKRGCRFFSVIDLMSDLDSTQTNLTCSQACGDAHSIEADLQACRTGCYTQAGLYKTAREHEQLMQSQLDDSDVIYPLMFMQSICEQMMQQVHQRMHISWSFFMGTSSDGKFLVIQSPPQFSIVERRQFPSDSKTSTYLETNLAQVDKSATPHVRDWPQAPPQDQEASPDWLTCITRRTGLPRLLLTVTLLTSALVMIWLCLSSAATAPQQKISQEYKKLSVGSDLSYLSGLADKELLMTSLAQEPCVQAAPLPIKVRVERI